MKLTVVVLLSLLAAAVIGAPPGPHHHQQQHHAHLRHPHANPYARHSIHHTHHSMHYARDDPPMPAPTPRPPMPPMPEFMRPPPPTPPPVDPNADPNPHPHHHHATDVCLMSAADMEEELNDMLHACGAFVGLSVQGMKGRERVATRETILSASMHSFGGGGPILKHVYQHARGHTTEEIAIDAGDQLYLLAERTGEKYRHLPRRITDGEPQAAARIKQLWNELKFDYALEVLNKIEMDLETLRPKVHGQTHYKPEKNLWSCELEGTAGWKF